MYVQQVRLYFKNTKNKQFTTTVKARAIFLHPGNDNRNIIWQSDMCVLIELIPNAWFLGNTRQIFIENF